MRIFFAILFNTEFSPSAFLKRLNSQIKISMTPETKNKWSVWINLILTTLTAILSALGM